MSPNTFRHVFQACAWAFIGLVILNISSIITTMGCEGFFCGVSTLPYWVKVGAIALIVFGGVMVPLSRRFEKKEDQHKPLGKW